MRGRIAWIDCARAYGMILVYYGHVINPLLQHHDPYAQIQFKLIYSFHMPLFFILAGYVARTPTGSALSFVASRIRTRLVPSIFFCALGVAGFAVEHAVLGQSPLLPPSWRLRPLLYGLPAMNHMTWFLFCLFCVDLLHLALHRSEGSRWRETFTLPVLFGLGWVVAWYHGPLIDALGLKGMPFYATEAVIAYAFFRTGRLLRRLDWLRPGRPLARTAAIAIAAGVGLLLTFELNQGPFTWRLRSAVIMAAMSHGNALLFPVTAILGSLMIFHLSGLTPASRTISFVGRNSLILLGLNGLFFHYVNKHLIALLWPYMSGSHWNVLGVAAGVTLASLLVCAPIIELLNRSVPWLVGQRSRHGASRS